jgi:hypothetical protein
MPEELEEVLRGAPVQEIDLENRLRKEWKEKEMVIGGARVEDFIAALSGTLEKIKFG